MLVHYFHYSLIECDCNAFILIIFDWPVSAVAVMRNPLPYIFFIKYTNIG